MSLPELAGLPPEIGRYQLRGLLGRGGMGRVLRAHDPVLKRDVALKLVEPAQLSPESLPELRFLFHREARATAALHHPGIIEIYDYSGPDAVLPFLACELCDGPCLRDVLEQRGALPAPVVAAMAHELAAALAHAHGHRIVHRDLKPENVFWLDGGRLVLADFGIAKAFDGRALGGTIAFGGTSLFGSPAFLAPEQLAGEPVGPAADLHALGALLYEALCGEQAFDGPDLDAILRAVLADTRPRLPRATPAPAELAVLIEGLLARSPAARPADAAGVAAAARRVLDALGATDPRLVLRDALTPGARDAWVAGDPTATTRPHLSGAAAAVPAPEPTPRSGRAVAPAGAPPTHAPAPAADAAASSAPASARRLPLVALLLVAVLVLGVATAAAWIWKSSGAPLVLGPGRGAAALGAMTVPVEIRIGPGATLLLDERELGTFSQNARLALPVGPHRLSARYGTTRVDREVLLVAGTTPAFDLTPPGGGSPP
jgi:serine/threonine-protein kinase